MTPEEFAHERAVRQIMEARIAIWLAKPQKRIVPVTPQTPAIGALPAAPRPRR